VIVRRECGHNAVDMWTASDAVVVYIISDDCRRRGVTDQQIIINAVREARLILREYIEPGSPNAEETIQRLIEVLDIYEVKHAIERLERCGNRSRLSS
jgi:hypothetical protein